jgi:hypothetical protein
MIVSTSSKIKAFFALGLITLAVSCKPDLNVNAPYKEIPIVYGLLSQNDSVHYVKITKAFLGEANAYDMAQIKDSSDYGDNLEVSIQEIKGSSTRSFNLEKKDLARPEQGIFPKIQSVYAFETPVNAPLSLGATYRLTAVNKITGHEISAETALIEPFDIATPTSILQQSISFVAATKLSDYTIAWTSAKNGMRYDVKLIFNYLEVDYSNPNLPDTAARKFEWTYAGIKSKSPRGGEKISLKVSGEDFLNRIKNAIPPAGINIERLIVGLDVVFDVAGEDLNTYMEVNEPATGIVIERPEFTNVAGGIGVFSSRYTVKRLGKGLSKDTCKEIKNNEITFGRGFTKFYDPGKLQFFCIEYNPDNVTCK